MADDMHCFRDDHQLYREVLEARRKAHEKHGDNSIERKPAGSPQWLAILVEEIGEVANSLTYDGPKGNLRGELIDVLAVASAYVSAIDAEAKSRQTDTVPTLGSYWIMTHPIAVGTKWRCTRIEGLAVRMRSVHGDGDLWQGTVAEFNNQFRRCDG